jgi:hypothetical protein
MSEGLPRVFETVESSAELMEYYNARIEAFKLTDPEFAEVVEPLLSFEQVEFVLQQMMWTMNGNQDNYPFIQDRYKDYSDLIIFNKETETFYKKIPVVRIRNGEGVKFISNRVDKSNEVGKIIPCYDIWIGHISGKQNDSSILTTIHSDELINLYHTIRNFKSHKYEDNILVLNNLGMSKKVYNRFLETSTHSKISVPRNLHFNKLLFDDYKIVPGSTMHIKKSGQGEKQFLHLYCDYNIVDSKIILDTYFGGEIQFGMFDHINIPNSESNSIFDFDWAFTEVERIFNTTLESDGMAFLTNSSSRYLVGVKFK